SSIVKSCSEFDNDQKNCENFQEQGKQCEFNVLTKKCYIPQITDKSCRDTEENACRDSFWCTYDVDNGDCNDAQDAIKGKCRVLQRASVCTANNCEWDGQDCTEKRSTKDIHIWKKLNLPALSNIKAITQVALSKNGMHIYAFNKSNDAEQGLYHSSDDGETWQRVGDKASGIVKALPFSNGVINNPSEAVLNTTMIEPAIKVTQSGALLLSGQKIILLEGTSATWGIDTTLHNQSTWYYNNQTENIKNESIKFVDVVNTQTGETIVFGQESPNSVFLKNITETSLNGMPKLFKTRNTGGGDLNQLWLRAGNTYNDNFLLLASAQGLWQFPKSHTNPTDPEKFGIVDQDARVLFPEEAGANINWRAHNIDYNFIGSLNNNGVHHYFAGLNYVAGSKAGGFAHFNGKQTSGQHAHLNFVDVSVLDISFVEVTRLTTSDGLLAIHSDGVKDPANDFSFVNLPYNTSEMKQDRSAMDELKPDDDTKTQVFGNNNKSFWWIHDKGIFIRSKSHGKPRS
ncbi:MAG: hypothetical protein KC505_10460, partial [Myxococcales bacterium]|nr:hypothetical protein [Myxococcales bacterium]